MHIIVYDVTFFGLRVNSIFSAKIINFVQLGYRFLRLVCVKQYFVLSDFVLNSFYCIYIVFISTSGM